MKVAIIDDSEISRVIISKELQALGLDDIDLYDSGASAWEGISLNVIDKTPYDLVTIDLNMPDLDGIDLIINIKKDELSKNLKIFVISAEASKTTMELTRNLGIDAYFTKPIDSQRLKSCVDFVLQGEKVDEKIAFCEMKI